MKNNIKNLVTFSKTLKVLVVEDNIESRIQVQKLLDNLFDNITMSIDGVDGLEKFTTQKFDFIIKSPPASHFIKEAAKLKGGSKEPGRVIVASITKKQAEDIAKNKMKDLNAHNLEQAVKIIKGSARSMGIEVKE